MGASMKVIDVIRIGVIGQIGVTVPDSGFRRLQPAQRQLLSLLVASGPSGLTADRLADEIWPERLPEQWQSAVRMTVSRLRSAAGVNFVEMIDGYYRLTLGVHQVDAWYLAQLTERSSITLSSGDVDRLVDLLGSGEIYGGVEPTITIEASIRELETAQRDLVAAAASSGLVLPRPVLRSLYRRVLTAPYDEDLCCDVVQLHAFGGALDAARDLIEVTRLELSGSFGVPLSEPLADLDHRLASGHFGELGNGAIEEIRIEPQALSLPLGLQIPVEYPDIRTEQAEQLTALLRSKRAVVVLSGPAGSSGLALVASALRRLDTEAGTVLFGRCSVGVSHSFEPFVEMLPGFRSNVARDMQSARPADQTSLWSAAVEELLDRAKGGPITMVIGSVDNIDSASIGMISFLVRSHLEVPFRLVLVGRSDVESASFAQLRRQMGESDSTTSIAIAPLTVAEVSTMVRVTFPHTSSAALRSISEEIHARSGGLPRVVAAIIQTLDPSTLLPPSTGTGQSLEVFSQIVVGLSPMAKSVGVAAAVLGRDASLGDLQQMTDLDLDELLDVVEELLDTGLLVETAGVDRLSFAHQLAMDEFINSTREIRLRQMHMKARSLTADPHRRARHDLLAHPSVPSAEVRGSQLRSARLLYTRGAFREAAAAFRHAQELLAAIPLETSDGILYADSVSRTGALAESAELRSAVITRCIAGGDWDGVLSAASVGLPEAENIDGDPERFAQLSSIPADRLSEKRRFELALHLTRQASLLGREAVSKTWVDRAEAMAQTSGQKAAVALAWRMANDVKESPSSRLERMTTSLKLDLTDSDRLHLLLVAAIDRYQLGGVDEAMAQITEFTTLAERAANPLRIWHSYLFRAMHQFTIGAWEESDRLAGLGLEHGQRFGITVAGPTRLAQQFIQLWLAGEHRALVPLFDAMPPDDARSLLFQAAHATSLFADDQKQRAGSVALAVCNRFLAAPAAHGLASLALVAPVLAEFAPPDLRERVGKILEVHSGTGLLVGAGAANLGPVDRYLHQLRGTWDSEACVRQVALADELAMPVWRLRSRLDLRAHGTTPALEAELVEIAAGTSFEALIRIH